MKLLALVLAAQVSTSSTTCDECWLALRHAVAARDSARESRDEWRAYAEGLEDVAREPVVETKVPAWVWILTGALVVGAAAGGAAGGAAASR